MNPPAGTTTGCHHDGLKPGGPTLSLFPSPMAERRERAVDGTGYGWSARVRPVERGVRAMP